MKCKEWNLLLGILLFVSRLPLCSFHRFHHICNLNMEHIERWTPLLEKHSFQRFILFLFVSLFMILQWKFRTWVIPDYITFYTWVSCVLRNYGDLNASYNYLEYKLCIPTTFMDSKLRMQVGNTMEFCLIFLICLLLTRLIFQHESFLAK